MTDYEAENERQYRVIDQMISMHSSLRDRFGAIARLIDFAMLIVALLLNAFVFASRKIFILINLDPAIATFGIGISAVCLLAFSITASRINFPRRILSHEGAVKELSSLKQQYRRVFNKEQRLDGAEADKLTKEYVRMMALLPPIPERQFNRLKKRHALKKLLSQSIERNPKVPIWILQIQFVWQGVRQALKE